MVICAFCGRENESDSRFCMDCGKPMNAHPPATRVGPAHVPGRFGGQPQPASRVVATAPIAPPAFAPAPRSPASGSPATSQSARLALLGEGGETTQSYDLDCREALIGREYADIKFSDDQFMSPLHARLERRDGKLCLRDLGSRNGTWVFIDQPTKLVDCDLLLIGSQLIRFRRLGYPGPQSPEADATRRMGSALPAVDIAVLEQLRADGSLRDIVHLSPGRSITIGRETGDWLFPYDGTMSGRHAEVRSEDNEFFVHDAQSRNGVAVSVRGLKVLSQGQRILVGEQMLRVESV